MRSYKDFVFDNQLNCYDYNIKVIIQPIENAVIITILLVIMKMRFAYACLNAMIAYICGLYIYVIFEKYVTPTHTLLYIRHIWLQGCLRFVPKRSFTSFD